MRVTTDTRGREGRDERRGWEGREERRERKGRREGGESNKASPGLRRDPTSTFASSLQRDLSLKEGSKPFAIVASNLPPVTSAEGSV